MTTRIEIETLADAVEALVLLNDAHNRLVAKHNELARLVRDLSALLV